MNHQRIGIRLESLGLPLRRALSEAERLGAPGVQVDAVGDLAPNTLSQTGRREFRNLLRTHNLELTALGCPLRRGLDSAADQEARIDHVRSVMSLSFDLGPRIAIVEPGRIPEDPKDPSAFTLTEALLALGQHGDRAGVVLALATGPRSGETLARYLATFDTGGLGANLDPANLLMNGFDPYESSVALRGRIVHCHARDARVSGVQPTAKEVPLGHGDIDWLRFAGTLEEIDYRGWLTVVRDSGDNRLHDVAEGVSFLRRFLR
jgi:L-ribulose-5-phosphate 3-epimerase